MTKIGVRLLGPVEVEVGGSPVALSRTLERALLARLALNPGQTLPFERLIDDLWGEQLPRDALASLQGLVYRLRRTLGDAGTSVVRREKGYALDTDPATVDAERFTALVDEARAARPGDPDRATAILRTALGLWRGDALESLEALPYAAAHRARLEAARLSALGDRVEDDLAAGRHAELVAELESLVAAHPYQEQFWGQLMLALYRSGAQADALKCFERLRTLLADELGLVPGPQVRALEHAILEHDPALDWSAPTPRPAAPAAAATATATAKAPADTTPSPGAAGAPGADSDLSWVPANMAAFVGRRDELRLIEAARQKAARERVLVVVTGEPGIGKTSLVAEMAAAAAAAGDLVLHGRWDEQVLCPFQGFREALGGYAQRAPEDRVRQEVGSLAPVLGRIVPELLDRLGLEEEDTRAAPEGDRFRIFHAVDTWLGAIGARHGLLLVLDDLHWADPPSLRLLEYLLRSANAGPLLVVATCRQSDADPAGWLSESLAGLRRAAAADHLSLRGLSEDEAVALLASVLGHPLGEAEQAGARNLQRHTNGNPFFLQAVGRDLLGEAGSLEAWADLDHERLPLPQHLRDVVRWRLRQLSHPSMEVLAAGSIIGQEFSAQVVGDTIGYDEDALVSVIDEARRAGVLVDGPAGSDRVRFSHAVVRRTLYGDLGEARRTRLHHRLAQTLEARPDAASPMRIEELARHYYLGAGVGGVDEAIRYARLAAADSVGRFAYESAAAQLERALELVTIHRPADRTLRSQLLLGSASASLKAGDVAGANERFLQAFEVAREGGRADLAAQAALGFGGVLPAGVPPNEQARTLLEQALGGLGDSKPELRALVLGRLAQWGHYDRPKVETWSLADEAVALARRTEDPSTLAAALGYRYWALTGPDDCDRQLASADEIRRLGERLDDPEIVLQGLKCELHTRFEVGDYEGSVAAAAAIGRLAPAIRQPEYLRLTHLWDGLVAGMEGRFDDAEVQAREAADIFQRTVQPQAHTVYLGLVLPWRWLQGRLDEVWPWLGAGTAPMERPAQRAVTAWVAAAVGGHGVATEFFDSVSDDDVVSADRTFPWWFQMVGLAQAAIILARHERAGLLYEQIARYSEHNCRAGQATFLGAASLHLGALALFLDRPADAVTHLEAAQARHLAMGARPLGVATSHLLAAALRGRGDAGDTEQAATLEATAERGAAELGVPGALLLRPS